MVADKRYEMANLVKAGRMMGEAIRRNQDAALEWFSFQFRWGISNGSAWHEAVGRRAPVDTLAC